MPSSPSSSCTVPMKMMSPRVRMPARFIARAMASMFATDALLSKMPGARSTREWRPATSAS
jgi:hypothetical protein